MHSNFHFLVLTPLQTSKRELASFRLDTDCITWELLKLIENSDSGRQGIVKQYAETVVLLLNEALKGETIKEDIEVFLNYYDSLQYASQLT
ncbi:hypothetical protein scyTo_0004542 [Scyliorhinus torazame]|uniref:Uncharacterized protein n=1 Tax=Scyliorhinus torazame TaxID=75743 RepID=A0A401NTB7_SCYTO|nr:hypothetical protein [Scyliorhinus torazame]